MNIRFILFASLLLSIPIWRSLLNGNLDPDQAAIRLAVAVALCTLVDSIIRTFVRATGATDPVRSDTKRNVK